MEQGGREADLISLLAAETDLMVDSVNTVAEVLGRIDSVPAVGTESDDS